jgi:hypothetical protein
VLAARAAAAAARDETDDGAEPESPEDARAAQIRAARADAARARAEAAQGTPPPSGREPAALDRAGREAARDAATAGRAAPPTQPRTVTRWSGAADPAGPPLPIAHAVSDAELSAMAKVKLKKGEMTGRAPSPNYNSLLYETRKGELGVAVQAWDESTIKDTKLRYEQMKATYPNVQDTANITPYTYFASWGDLYYLVFMDLKKRRVVSVAASAEVLSPHKLYQLGVRVHERLVR